MRGRRIGALAVAAMLASLLLGAPPAQATCIPPTPDGSDGASVDLPVAEVGQPYTTSLTATGGSGQYHWEVIGSLPPGLTDNSAGNDSGTLTISGTPSGGPTGVGDFTFTVNVYESFSGSYDEFCYATSDYTITVPASDLSVTEDAEPDPVYAGDVARFTTQFRNFGGESAENVVVDVAIEPSSAQVIGARWQLDEQASQPCFVDGDDVSCDIGELAATGADRGTVVIRARATQPGTLVGSASISSDAYDPNSGNDTSQRTLEVLQDVADIGVRLHVPSRGRSGEREVIELDIQNNGPDTAHNVSVFVGFPTGDERLAGVDSDYCTPQTGLAAQVDCDVLDVPADTTVTIQIPIRARADGDEDHLVKVAAFRRETYAYEDAVGDNDVDRAEFVVEPVSDLRTEFLDPPTQLEVRQAGAFRHRVRNRGPNPAFVRFTLRGLDVGRIIGIRHRRLVCGVDDSTNDATCLGWLEAGQRSVGTAMIRWPSTGRTHAIAAVRSDGVDRAGTANVADAEVLITPPVQP